jgi:hypothetical protein
MPRPKKQYKSLDDEDEDVTVILESNNKLEKDEDEVEPVEIVEDLSEESVINDDIQVSGNADDGDLSVSMTSVRRNMPPPKSWDEGKVLPFKTGDLVCLKVGETVFKVIAPGRIENTYEVKASGCDSTLTYDEVKLKKAPVGATWKSYWDTVNDPYMAWKKKQKAIKEATKKPSVVIASPKTKVVRKRKSKK